MYEAAGKSYLPELRVVSPTFQIQGWMEVLSVLVFKRNWSGKSPYRLKRKDSRRLNDPTRFGKDLHHHIRNGSFFFALCQDFAKDVTAMSSMGLWHLVTEALWDKGKCMIWVQQTWNLKLSPNYLNERHISLSLFLHLNSDFSWRLNEKIYKASSAMLDILEDSANSSYSGHYHRHYHC